MTILNRLASNWSRVEREKLNTNWSIIENYLSNLQRQINLLTGDVNVQELIDKINDIFNQGNVIIGDLEAALQDASIVITNAQNATTDANNAAQEALNAINDMQAFINQFGNAETYDNSKLYKINNIVEFDGSGFICIQNTQGNQPPTLPTKRNEWWQLIAQRGVDGTGAVSKVAGKSPEVDGNVLLTAQDVGAASNTDFISVARFGNTKSSITIQAALDFAENKGGAIIMIPSGTYEITSVLRIPSNTSLITEGEVILKRMANINAILINDADSITGGYDANKNITIKGIIFDANNSNFTDNTTSLAFGHCTNIKVEDCEFLNCTTWHDVEINGCDVISINQCTFGNYSGNSEALQLDFMGSDTQFPWFLPYDNTPCKNIFITNNTFKSTARTKVAIGNHSFLNNVVTKNVVVKNNTFLDFQYVIVLNDLDTLLFKENNCHNCLFGIVYSEKENQSKNWYIESNTFENNRDYSDSPGVEGRFFFGQTNNPIKGFNNIMIKGNIVRNCKNHAIGLTSTKNISIINNIIENNGGNGIYMYGGSKINIENNILNNNNTKQEVGRADIVVGANTNLITSDVLVSNNNMESYITAISTSKVLVINNIIKTSTGNNGGSEEIKKNNLIAGVWTS